MRPRVEHTNLPGVVLLRYAPSSDDRGDFVELFRADEFAEIGVPFSAQQLNWSRSARGVVRGLHFQWSPPMGKLVRVVRGKAFLVAVDVLATSPTLGKWYAIEVAEADNVAVWAPAHFARGFCALEDFTEVEYLCSGTYNAECEAGVLWNDPRIGIPWPHADAILSAKDSAAPTLDEWLSSERARSVSFDASR